ncbi:MAG: NAD(+)/NADH kinase [archaeon]|nr:NAD(+)/NADH kinase [archaeon]
MDSLLETLSAIADAVKHAVDLIPTLEERGVDIEIGADGTPTSEVDKIAENTVLDYLIRNNVPLNVLSEEIGYVDNGYDEVLVLDPIDGTSNCIAGVPMYTISMAIGKNALSDVHTVYLRNLVTGDSMWAQKGKGTYKNGKKVTVRKMDPKDLFMMIYLGNGADPKAFDLAKRVQSSRSYGCSSLEMALVAEGQADGFYMHAERYNRGIRVVDIAASYLLLIEAGGYIYDLSGKAFDMPLTLEARSNFLACNDPQLFDFVINGKVFLKDKPVYGILTNPSSPKGLELTQRAYSALKGETVVLDNVAAEILGLEGVSVGAMDVDVMITIGGDGTILRTAIGNPAAIVGINGGGVGFLAEIEPDDVEAGIAQLRKGDYVVEERFKLDTYCNGTKLESAVNETVIHTDAVGKIRQFKIYVDDVLATEVRADGIIISTPTGSTCYAMSLGAPITEPSVNAFIIVPMAAYKFASRPFIVPAESKITVECVLDRGCLVVIDGQAEHHVDGGTRIDLVRSPKKVRFLRFGKDFFLRVREKLVNAI